ncbi:MAG: potassium transporter [Verrucomicrobiaceae bacterium]|nr:potassium transporter [Verrucomicrobiaceae bacterium]
MTTATTSGARTPTLALAALGVVYGDIGTSPLYTIKEIFGAGHHPVPITHFNVLGMMSLILWSLLVVVTMKYVVMILRADNKGEGGIMALMALVLRAVGHSPYSRGLMLLGLFGAALFYGDSVITPAISVLSAVEGLEVAAPGLAPYVIPITLLVLIALFIVQRHGTAKVGRFFGPIMMLWFLVLAVIGVHNIAQYPEVLLALSPHHAVQFFLEQPKLGFFSLGASVLALTGAEALYADMGHFGRKPVQMAWFGVVLPALVLNYFGQGALLLGDPSAVENPFYRSIPDWALYPMIGLSTVAAIIASQAVISGAYSMTRQAIQLGYVPRLLVQHTSSHEHGQIYIPAVNWALLTIVMALVVGFGSSSNLAAAYGIAVTGTMLCSTVLAFIVVRHIWHWHWAPSALVIGSFLTVDIAYFSSNMLKVKDGGWFPLVLAALVFFAMTTWKRGRMLLNKRLSEDSLPLDLFIQGTGGVTAVPGTAIFLSSQANAVPHALLHSIKHYKCLHQRIIILHVHIHDEPYVGGEARVQVERVNEQFYTIGIHFGFMDELDLPAALAYCAPHGVEFDLMDTSFFLGRETLIPRLHSEMVLWREKIYIAMYRNAGSITTYFGIPPNRVVELGSQVVL